MAVNLQKTKTPMPTLDAEERIKNFNEVSTGYTEEMLQNEAARCLNCPNRPCMAGCPVHNKIPEFIALAREGKYEEAYNKVRETSTLPAVCGRVCPQELQCEKECVRGRAPGGEPVAIGRIERWISDWHSEAAAKNNAALPNSASQTTAAIQSFAANPAARAKVAIVGSGPSGLSCANDLAVLGYEVTIYESKDVVGGVLTYGIPAFVLPKATVQSEVDNLLRLGVKIITGATAGKDITIEELKKQHDAVYVACGTGKSKAMGIEGESAFGVFPASDYLYAVNLGKPLPASKHTVVVGGGNVAMDAARCARRLGAEVTIVYRRDREQMPSRHEEIINTLDEGVNFETLSNPVKIITATAKEHAAVLPYNASRTEASTQSFAATHRITAIECVKMSLTEETDSRGKKTKPIEGSNYTIDCDCVVMALGYDSEGIITGIETEKGLFKTNEKLMTSVDGVFAGGDIVTGPSTVIKAMGTGRAAAKNIHDYLSQK